jgi:SagB-type dehydrogenase family enzyme
VAADSDPRAIVDRYHDGTKHHFHAFARSLGYLDWASQPNPFRRFDGAPSFPLYPIPSAPTGRYERRSPTYAELFDPRRTANPVSAAAVGDLLRHSLGLSAWKQFGASRWSLRVNPSSGNLHPTEAYVICGPLDGLAPTAGVYHYASDRHALELRCSFDAPGGLENALLIALTSIHWRESWKYGERAFRYCQHDLGHAVGAIAIACGLVGWRAELLPGWSHQSIAALVGLDRDGDFVEAEREDAGCVLSITDGSARAPAAGEASGALQDAVRNGRWTGRASQLSEDHVQWTFIDDVARATEGAGNGSTAEARATSASRFHQPAHRDGRTIILQRRSAVAFDGRSSTDRSTFLSMMSRVMPAGCAPWDALWWKPRVHLAIFVHRVDGLDPGLYLLARAADAVPRLKAACGREFLWEPADANVPLLCLVRGDARRAAARLSCDQAIAGDGFFSLGMIAEFASSLDTHGPAFYRNLFWETGVIGQVLYLEAEAAGARATGIGCFYDDPVHEVLGLEDRAFQSLYHFSMGIPVEDARLTTSPGYAWELPRT